MPRIVSLHLKLADAPSRPALAHGLGQAQRKQASKASILIAVFGTGDGSLYHPVLDRYAEPSPAPSPRLEADAEREAATPTRIEQRPRLLLRRKPRGGAA